VKSATYQIRLTVNRKFMRSRGKSAKRWRTFFRSLRDRCASRISVRLVDG
jgi:hypothetical protein